MLNGRATGRLTRLNIEDIGLDDLNQRVAQNFAFFDGLLLMNTSRACASLPCRNPCGVIHLQPRGEFLQEHISIADLFLDTLFTDKVEALLHFQGPHRHLADPACEACTGDGQQR